MIHEEPRYDYLGTHFYAYEIDVWQSGKVRVYETSPVEALDDELPTPVCYAVVRAPATVLGRAAGRRGVVCGHVADLGHCILDCDGEVRDDERIKLGNVCA